MNETVLIGVLCGIAGIIVGVLAMLAYRASEQRKQDRQPLAEPTIPEGAIEVLAVMGRAYVVVDAVDGVVRASPSAYAFGLVRGNHIAFDELRGLTDRVRTEDTIVDRSIDIPRGPLGGGTWTVHLRLAPLGDEFILILAEDRSELTRSQAIRHDFVANVSHELKTPVGAIRLLGEAIDDAADDPVAVRRFSSRLSVETVRLASLVQDIIELSRLQGRDSIEEAQPVNLNEVAAEAVDHVHTEAESRNIRVALSTTDQAMVFGDPDQLMTAIRNLVINAVNYSPENTTVGVGVRARKGLIEISVKDQGPGILPEEQERIFERFYRIDTARSRATGGTGLGLSIVKHVVANHGGEVTVWSAPKQGSTFTVRLPEMTPEVHEEITLGATAEPIGSAQYEGETL